jgi:hypothetical protein
MYKRKIEKINGKKVPSNVWEMNEGKMRLRKITGTRAPGISLPRLFQLCGENLL